MESANVSSGASPHIPRSACHLSDLGSPEQLRLVLGWIDICVREHENCRPSSSSHDFVPSTLLDVGDPGLLKLVECLIMHLRPESYIALSYCWRKQAQQAAYVSTRAVFRSTAAPYRPGRNNHHSWT